MGDFDSLSQIPAGSIFGRASDIRKLADRTNKTGITILTGRPLMGKSSTLLGVTELIDKKDCVFGYHNSTGSEKNLLLYAVSDLYQNWLSDSDMRDKAITLWKKRNQT